MHIVAFSHLLPGILRDKTNVSLGAFRVKIANHWSAVSGVTVRW